MINDNSKNVKERNSDLLRHSQSDVKLSDIRMDSINCVGKVKESIYNKRGILLAIATAFASAFVTFLVSILRGSVSSSQLTLVRGFFSYILTLVFLIYKKIPIKPTSCKEFKFFAINGIFSSSGIFATYYAYQNMPTGDATAIVYSYIALSLVFGRIILKERVGWIEAVMVGVSLTGVVLIVRPTFLFGSDDSSEYTRLIPALCALFASIACAFATVTLRVLGQQNTHPLKAIHYCAVFLFALGVISVTIKQEWSLPDCTIDRLLIVCFGFISYLVLATFAYALAFENIAVVTVLTVSEVWIVFFVDIFLLGTSANILSIIGITLIVSSSIGISAKKVFEMRKESAENCLDDKMYIEEKIGSTKDFHNDRVNRLPETDI